MRTSPKLSNMILKSRFLIKYTGCLILLFLVLTQLFVACDSVSQPTSALTSPSESTSQTPNTRTSQTPGGSTSPTSSEGASPTPNGSVSQTPKPPLLVVCIDPGHGGSQPGTLGWDDMIPSYDGCAWKYDNNADFPNEKDINLDVALKLESILKKQGFEVIMTRTMDVDVSDAERVRKAKEKNSDIFVSIHCNAQGCGPGNQEPENDATGTLTYYAPLDKNGEILASFLQDELVNTLGLRDGRKNEGSYNVLVGAKKQDGTKLPAALVELVFLTNRDDFKYILSHEQDAANAIANGILRYFGKQMIPFTTNKFGEWILNQKPEIDSYVTTSPPTMDGLLSPGEWPEAAIVEELSYLNGVTGVNEHHFMSVYSVHDNQNLYIAIKVEGDDYQSGINVGDGELWGDVLEIYFDSNNNGIIEVNEDIKNFWGLTYGDWYYRGGFSWSGDQSNHGIAVATHSSMDEIGDYVYEFKIPLNSGDIQDISILPSSEVGIKISFREMYKKIDANGRISYSWGTAEDVWPQASQYDDRFNAATYGKLILIDR